MQEIARHTLTPITLRVNGHPYRAAVETRLLLSDFLRQECGLTGTHVGCEHGVCGACTVLVNGIAVRSCLILAVAVAGAEITTIEGLARHPAFPAVYRAFTEHHALQCGFCTPGIVVSVMAELIDPVSQILPPPRGPEHGAEAHNGQSLEERIIEILSGHLCRCTGYQGIKEAVRELAQLAIGSQ